MKICQDPRHDRPCYPNTCPNCALECDPKYFKEVTDAEYAEIMKGYGWRLREGWGVEHDYRV
jgi:hypothetical protein